MKTINIQIPEGHEIDQENSNLSEGKIVFKEVKKALPKTWEELKQIKGYWIADTGHVYFANCSAKNHAKMIFATEELAKASIAVAQLSQLRDVYRDGWKPNWEDDEPKYSIRFEANKILTGHAYANNRFLSFQSAEIRDEFINNFRDLIETAKPLI